MRSRTTTWRRALIFGALVCVVTGAAAGATAEETPQIDPDEGTIVCAVDDGREVRLQCDEDRKRCLIADAFVLDRAGEPTGERPPDLNPCKRGEPGVVDRLEQQGYELVEARLESEPGYTRDERGRLFQSSFHLRRRAFLGLYDGMLADFQGASPTLDHSLAVEVGGRHDRYDDDAYDDERTRRRILEGRLRLNPLEVEAVLGRWTSVDTPEDDDLWLTIAGNRIDIPVSIGYGMTLGNLRYNRLDETGVMLLDVAGVHVDGELFQTRRAENYVTLRLGAGGGVRHQTSDDDSTPMYLYPELAFETAWTIGDRGLTALRADARLQPAVEVASGSTWMTASANASVEQVLFAARDEPVTLFVQPEMRYRDLDFADVEALDYRLFAGVRLNIWVPPFVQD